MTNQWKWWKASNKNPLAQLEKKKREQQHNENGNGDKASLRNKGPREEAEAKEFWNGFA